MKFIWYVFASALILSIAQSHTHNVKVHVVTMEGMKFNPKVLEIKVGETIRWVNQSNSAHNVIANDKSFESRMLTAKGDVFEHTFRTTGVFPYFCQPHKIMGMKGQIIVKKP